MKTFVSVPERHCGLLWTKPLQEAEMTKMRSAEKISRAWIAAACAGIGATIGAQVAHAQAPQPVTIRFAAQIGDQAFACGRSYEGIGSPASRIMPSDFRFYVSEVHLVDESGKAVPVRLEQDGRWQHRDVALLDFEDRSGPCLTGTAETRDVVTGTIPPGRYRGLRFTLGVPFALNHEDSTIAPSPLNLTSLFWSWQAGYKFVRIDLGSAGRPQTIKPGEPMPTFGDAEGSLKFGFAIHLGSTMCSSGGRIERPTECRNPNRATIDFPEFDTSKQVVVADLKALLEGVNVDVNQPKTPAGCMSSPNDGDCDPLMRNFGVSFGGKASEGQRFFRIR
jgi:uncharacterized repeat protein (TIGR04052 family)